MSREAGTFSNHGNGLKYVALSRAAKVANRPAYEIAALVSEGRLPVHEVSGAKAVALLDLMAFAKGAE